MSSDVSQNSLLEETEAILNFTHVRDAASTVGETLKRSKAMLFITITSLVLTGLAIILGVAVLILGSHGLLQNVSSFYFDFIGVPNPCLEGHKGLICFYSLTAVIIVELIGQCTGLAGVLLHMRGLQLLPAANNLKRQRYHYISVWCISAMLIIHTSIIFGFLKGYAFKSAAVSNMGQPQFEEKLATFCGPDAGTALSLYSVFSAFSALAAVSQFLCPALVPFVSMAKVNK